MRFIRANGGVVCYRDEGRRDGPAFVFINALGSDLRIWDDVAAILSPEFRIVRYDKRGHGLSELGPDRCDMADYARDLGALLDALGVVRATVVGLSIGGLIAQELYRQRPELFSALVLSDTAAKIGTDEILGRPDRRRSSAAGSRRSPTPSSSAGSPRTSAPTARTNSPAGARC